MPKPFDQETLPATQFDFASLDLSDLTADEQAQLRTALLSGAISIPADQDMSSRRWTAHLAA